MSLERQTGTEKLRTWAEIDLTALADNARACARIAGENARLMAVVKADGYGHGIVEVVSALAALPRVWGFGVANLEEAQTIAAAIGEGQTVLILGPVLPEEREAAVEGGFAVGVSSENEARAFSEIGSRCGKTVSAHVTVDTGMGRMGVLPAKFSALIECVCGLNRLKLDGVATHFPSADEDGEFTRKQIAEFQTLVEGADLPPTVHVHAANSAGVLAFSEALNFTHLVRCGLALYGVAPVPPHAEELQPVLSLKSRLTLVRDLPAGRGISYGRTFVTDRPTTVATIGIGYGDGYPRSLSGNGAEVLIAGQRCPLLGRVTMDQIMVDVGALETRPNVGDEVVLIGDEISTTEIAHKAGTIAWEIFTGITQRVTRVYR
jgi:alanine racemase